jgi:glyoxylase-like metal-dependent hydrolase (beta-lactamase superfamily II)
MELAPGVHHFDTGPFNWYLLREEGRLTLVDAGFPGHYRTFLAGIRSLGHELKDLEAILLTHAHADHTGFAERLRRETGAPVFIHRADRGAIGRVLQLPWWGLLSNAWRPYTRSMLGHAIGAGVFTIPSIAEARTFDDSDVLDVPGRPRVIHTPGHTPGEVSFFLEARGVLICGDTLITRNLLTGKPGGPQVCSRVLNESDPDARRSLDRLRELGRVTMLPGHGTPWAGTMSEAVERARR